MRKPMIAGNWKMYKTVHEAVVFTKEFRQLAQPIQHADLVIAPPFTAVHAAAEVQDGYPLAALNPRKKTWIPRPRTSSSAVDESLSDTG